MYVCMYVCMHIYNVPIFLNANEVCRICITMIFLCSLSTSHPSRDLHGGLSRVSKTQTQPILSI